MGGFTAQKKPACAGAVVQFVAVTPWRYTTSDVRLVKRCPAERPALGYNQGWVGIAFLTVCPGRV